MQQQIPPQEQYGTPQQMSQPMMLCPIQYVYESPMVVPQQNQDDQIQQNQMMFNVQNTPPWIQNRPQNQYVLLQQIPSNYQPYVHQQMVQTPVYQQYNYIQPSMIAQDTRQFVQIPNVTPYNNVQNQTPAQNNESNERMPLLTQMLNQKAMANARAPNVNNVPGSVNNLPGSVNNLPGNVNNLIGNVNNLTGNVNIRQPRNIRPPGAVIRPVMQNQQVQTDIIANNRGRPKTLQPQIISINPIQHQYIQTPEVLINLQSSPRAPYIREVPQHIRSKVPSSISVKTVYRPIHPRTIIRPYDVTAPQNIYYSPNYVTLPNPEMRNTMSNTDNSATQNNTQVQMSNVCIPVSKNIANNQNEIDARNAGTAINSNNVKAFDNNPTNRNAITTDAKIQTEEKLIRNTVYVQARGRVLNEHEIQNQPHSLKRMIDERTDGNVGSPANSEIAIKYMKVETNEISTETNRIPVKTEANVPGDFSCQQTKIKSFPNETNKVKIETENIVDHEKYKPMHKQVESINTQDIARNLEQRIGANILKETKAKKDTAISKLNDENNKPAHKTEENMKHSILKSDVTILTHVLDGYIIQESNVAFPIQRPMTERENRIRDEYKIECDEKDNRTDNFSVEHSDRATPLKDKGPSTELRGHLEVKDKNKDNPFAGVAKSTVESWTSDQLAAHLTNHDWKETAAKLHDEEIDGESLLLVNKDQLVAIGVCEKHAEAITAFAAL